MKKTVDVKTVIKDLDDKNSQPSVNPDELPEGNEVRNIEEKMKKANENPSSPAPNAWFKYDHPVHGPLEVTAHHSPEGTKLLSVGMPNDAHISFEEADLDDHVPHIQQQAQSLGEGNHMNTQQSSSTPIKKSEYTAQEIVLEALKKVSSKRLDKAEEMKIERDPQDMGSVYSEDREVGNQNSIQEYAKREHAKLNGKKLKEFVEKVKNKSQKDAEKNPDSSLTPKEKAKI